MSRYWRIEGFDSSTPIFETKVKVGYFSNQQIEVLLMALAAKAGLEYDEIVGAYARKGSKIANELLTVQRDGPWPVYSCGSNPHFVARVVSDDG